MAFQVGPDIRRRGVHPAFRIRDGIKIPVMEYALIVNQAAGILRAEIIRHGKNILPCVRLIAAGPEQNGHMVFIPLKYGHGPVQHTGLPLRQAAGNIPVLIHLPSFCQEPWLSRLVSSIM